MLSGFSKPLAIQRATDAPELLANGTYLNSPTEEIKIMASVQPLKANEMMLLPEGSRTARAVKVYSDVELLAAEQRDNVMADRFMWKGMLFEIVASDMYQSDVISHYRAYATEVKRY